MGETSSNPPVGLSRLAIDRSQRPVASRRGWVLLAFVMLTVVGLGTAAGYWYYATTGTNIIAVLGEQPIEVGVMTVAPPSATAQGPVLVANGKIVSDRRVNVATKVSGQIVELNVEQGDVVAQGDVLARVEDVIYRAQRDEAAAGVERDRFAIARAKTERTRAHAAVERAQAELTWEEYSLARLQRLQGTSDASDFEFVNAKSKFDASKAALAVAKAEASASESAISLAEAELTASQATLRLLEKRLDDCAIRAPISGVILERNAQIGDFLAAEGGRGANANAQLVAIADMTLLRVEIDVSERDVQRAFAGQPARITPDSNRTATYQGKVMWVDPVGDYARAVVQVKVRVLDPGPDLRVDGSAKVEFLSPAVSGAAEARASSTTWLPKGVVKLTPGSDEGAVFTVENQRAVSHPVTIGARTDKSVEVKSSLTPGMQLIADNLDKISAGTLVKVARSVMADEMQ